MPFSVTEKPSRYSTIRIDKMIFIDIYIFFLFLYIYIYIYIYIFLIILLYYLFLLLLFYIYFIILYIYYSDIYIDIHMILIEIYSINGCHLFHTHRLRKLTPHCASKSWSDPRRAWHYQATSTRESSPL